MKEELARNYPRLRFAFSRPGFITFKDFEGSPLSPDFQLRSVFARSYGVSLGNVDASDPVPEIITAAEEISRSFENSLLRLHVWERSEFVPGEEPPGYISGVVARELESRLRIQAPQIFYPGLEAKVEELVLDVIVLETKEKPKVFLGFHRHQREHDPWPGGEIPVELPTSAPSRAFLKLEQAIRWGRLPLAAGDTAVELGSAPGGASYSLLLRGLEVWGIDPGAMSPVVWTDPRCEKRFHHVKKAFSDLNEKDLPSSAQWVVLDINGPARVSLPYVEQLLLRYKPELMGAVLTFKLNDPKHSRHIPEWITRLSELGLRQVRARQLPSNKREICVIGLTGRGILRLQSRS
ncbi:MAG: hypothetical protein KGQ59_02410 [Bdellovibrionales bacterium]|nr:hypothetical protein [Bdellovibrionales bacterium]